MIRSTTSSKSDLHFDYDAMGQRICKIVKPRNGSGVLNQAEWTYTYYVRDAQGNTIAVYDRDFIHPDTKFYDVLSQKENHLYGSSRVGVKNDTTRLASQQYSFVAYNTDSTFDLSTPNTLTSTATDANSFVHEMGRKSYELVNHLGNVLVTVSDMRTANYSGVTVTGWNAVVNSATDYYAFGSPMEGRSYYSTNYRYGFNGKENDPESVGTGEGLQDYGMRIYNPGLGRFLSMDPITAKYAYLTPYQFASNTPIGAIDFDGLEKYVIIYTHYADGRTTAKLQVLTYAGSGAPNLKTGKNIRNKGSNDPTKQVQIVHNYPSDPSKNTNDTYFGSISKLNDAEKAAFSRLICTEAGANISINGEKLKTDIWEATIDVTNQTNNAPQPSQPTPAPSTPVTQTSTPVSQDTKTTEQIDVGYDLSAGNADQTQYSTNPYVRSNKDVYTEVIDRANTQAVTEIHISFGFPLDKTYSVEQRQQMSAVIESTRKEVEAGFQGYSHPKIIVDKPHSDFREHAYVELITEKK